MTSINPIIPGFAPDPSVVKVADWFFLCNSSFHLFPGLPIYASQDLVSWKQIGNAINRQSQLSLRNSDTRLHPLEDKNEVLVASGGLYAPTIRYKDGTFYIVCTNVINTGPKTNTANFIISTNDIWSDYWSDPVYFEFDGIDPSIYFDEEYGKVYIQGSAGPGPYTTINLFEINLVTGTKISEERIIWRGTGGIYPEGPHLYKRKDWYYLLIAEGGTHDGHMVTMARSKDIWGPYEASPNNPILTARGTDEYIQYTGHCDIFEDDNTGRWWCTCLGVRKDSGGRFIMGRETHITPMVWNEEWPVIERVKTSPLGLDMNLISPRLVTKPSVDFVYIRDPVASNYHLIDSTSGTILASRPDLSHPQMSPSFIGKRQRLLNGSSSVSLHSIHNASQLSKLRTGLACYKDEHRYVWIYYDTAENTVSMELVNKAKGIRRTERHELRSRPVCVHFSIKYSEQSYRLEYSSAETATQSWVHVATVDTLDMTGPDFTGPILGVCAFCETDGAEVEFQNLAID
ncbi:glycosyl hydrolase [Aspergillus ambiguus]|uniref:putative xylosidase/arabinosidase n=1 Tax=Aspergillus ambiguus TaxID=176160 RepID=UPI003CCE52F2